MLRDLAPKTLEILAQFKKARTRKQVADATGYDRNLINSTVTRLRNMYYLEDVPAVKSNGNEVKGAVWLKITDGGRKALNPPKPEAKTKPRDHTTYSKAAPSPLSSDARSLMNRPPYEPPAPPPLRDGALDFKNIPSKGVK